ncbi:MAG: glutamyl-tRNA reductase [Vulcanibacillus sp.]
MYVIVVGLNYKTAPVEVREKFSFTDNDVLNKGLIELRQTKSVLEAVILSTCNRTEIYAVVDQLHAGEHFIKGFIAKWFSIPKEELNSFLYINKDQEATEHLFRVVSGLDSMIVGETQILGQIRKAFLIAQQNGVTGTILNTLFKQAITFAKKAHSETRINEGSVSVSYVAVELAKEKYHQLDNKSVLIVGAGKMGELTAIHLHSNGIKQIMVANRTYERAERLANSFRGEAYTMDEISDAIAKADIVISSTGSDTLVINKALIEKANIKRDNKPLLLIDIAVPRDIESSVKEIENVSLYDIDDLRNIVTSNMDERKNVATKIDKLIGKEVDKFYNWVETLGVVPLITALREKSLRIQAETMKSIENKLPDLNERELKIIRKHTRSIVNQMLKNPIVRVKELSVEADADILMDYFMKIFDIKEDEINPNIVYEKKKCL